jgi:hypothetical protein
MSRLSCTCPVLVVLFRLPCLAILSRPGCHVMAGSVLADFVLADFVLAGFVLTGSVLAVLSWLSLPDSPVLAVLSSNFLALTVLSPSWFSCPRQFAAGCPILAVLSPHFYPGCPVLVVLSVPLWHSPPGCPALAVLS